MSFCCFGLLVDLPRCKSSSQHQSEKAYNSGK